MSDRFDRKAGEDRLSRRNAETATAAIFRFEKLLHEGLSVISAQQNTLRMLLDRVSQLENALNIEKMKLTGLGPTVKPPTPPR
jgi:hypothetical protein